MTNPLTILTLDLGTQTGWAIRSHRHPITSGTIAFKNDRWQGGGMRYLKFTQFLKQLHDNAGPIQADIQIKENAHGHTS